MSAASSSRASAAQPGASSRKRSLSQLSLAEETAEQTATPLYDRLLLNLEMCGSRGEELLAYITQSCFFDDLLAVGFSGEILPRPMPLAAKMERLLETANQQRQIQLDKLRLPSNEKLDDESMKQMYNTW